MLTVTSVSDVFWPSQPCLMILFFLHKSDSHSHKLQEPVGGGEGRQCHALTFHPMCAHLVGRWSREYVFNIFLDKSTPGWSGQECFLSHFRNLYGPTVRIIQGLEHQNLQAKSGMPRFISLLHFQPPFSYYCWQTTQRCCTQVCSSVLQDLTPSGPVHALCWNWRCPMLCARRSSLLCRGNNEQNTLEGFFWTNIEGLSKKVDTLQNSYLFPPFPEAVSLLKCGTKQYAWVAAGLHWKYPRWQREEFSSLHKWKQRLKVFLAWWGILPWIKSAATLLEGYCSALVWSAHGGLMRDWLPFISSPGRWG